jgi:hypothetical protein
VLIKSTLLKRHNKNVTVTKVAFFSTSVLMIIGIALIALATLSMIGFPWIPLPSGEITGSGNLVTEDMDFMDFLNLEVGWAFEVNVSRSETYSVQITADDNLFDYIEASKLDNTLRIGLKQGYNYRYVTLQATITMPDLYSLDFSGTTGGAISGFNFTHVFDAGVSGASSLSMCEMVTGQTEFLMSGASRLTGSVTVDGDVQFIVSGASTVELLGEANNIAIDASGASNVNLSTFSVNNANVLLSGASQATINLEGILDANLSGASHLLYIGNPTLGDIETSGSSTVEQTS